MPATTTANVALTMAAAAGVAAAGQFAQSVTGAPIGVYIGAIGGLMIAVQRMPKDDRMSTWGVILALYACSVSLAGGAIAYWPALKEIPGAAIGVLAGLGLPEAIPGFLRLVARLPEWLGSRFGKSDDPKGPQ